MDDAALLASFRYAQRQDRLIGQLGHAAVALHEAETPDERKAARVAAIKRQRELERAKIRQERRQQRIAARRAAQGAAMAAE
jgi:hypothetical protein